MNLEIFSKFLVVSLAGGGLIAVPATKFSTWDSSEPVNLFLESLSQNQNILKNVSKESLTKSKCKVLVTDVENNKSQIIVCPTGASVTFLYTTEDSQEMEKIKGFSRTVSSGSHRGGSWKDDYNLQFQLTETRNSRASAFKTIKISEQDNSHFSKSKDWSLSTCKLEEDKLLCKISGSQSSTQEIPLNSSVSQEFLIR